MFASFNTNYEDSDFVLLGIPFDKTSSFRSGTAGAPKKIRELSYCFEPYMMEYDISLSDLKLHDHGNLKDIEDVEEMGDKVSEIIKKIIIDEKFPIILGGEHSISPFTVSAFDKIFDKINVVVLDAHLDYRDEYEGDKRSHATVVKRIEELENVENILIYGVRSMAEESKDLKKPEYYRPDELDIVLERTEKITENPTYLSIDIDVLDPSFAPGVGNPEPYGIKPKDVKKIIGPLSKNLVGLDIVETNPKYDSSDITSNLAARFVYDTLGSINQNKRK